jgi:ribosomal protein S18 acetylase RimI-like enzyme
MATHPDFLRMGLGKATIQAGLAQLFALGAIRATVGTSTLNHRSQAMYRSTGFGVYYRRAGYQFDVYANV